MSSRRNDAYPSPNGYAVEMTPPRSLHNIELPARLPRAQLERLSFIDFRLYFLGELRRADVMNRFGTGPAGATRDIGTYREIAPRNLDFDTASKVYVPSQDFVPLFEHPAQRTLMALSRGFGQGFGDDLTPLVRCEFPTTLAQRACP